MITQEAIQIEAYKASGDFYDREYFFQGANWAIQQMTDKMEQMQKNFADALETASKRILEKQLAIDRMESDMKEFAEWCDNLGYRQCGNSQWIRKFTYENEGMLTTDELLKKWRERK